LATFAKDQIGEVVVCREDGRVTIRFDNGRLLMGRDVESFERVLDQKEEMSRVVGSAPWSPEEDERLRVLALSGTSVAAIAKQMKRSTAAVRNRAYLLKIVVVKSSLGAKGEEMVE
jgi:hypothetical protein